MDSVLNFFEKMIEFEQKGYNIIKKLGSLEYLDAKARIIAAVILKTEEIHKNNYIDIKDMITSLSDEAEPKKQIPGATKNSKENVFILDDKAKAHFKSLVDESKSYLHSPDIAGSNDFLIFVINYEEYHAKVFKDVEEWLKGIKEKRLEDFMKIVEKVNVENEKRINSLKSYIKG